MYHKMLKEICAKEGKVYSKRLEIKNYGSTDRQVCENVVKELDLNMTVGELERIIDEMSQKVLPRAPLQKGAERLLNHLHNTGVPIALATNSSRRAVRMHVAARPKLFGLFHHMCLVFEDSTTGLDAAIGAGMQVVFVPGTSLPSEDGRKPTITLRSLLDFKPEAFGLPPFTDNPTANMQKKRPRF